MFDFHRIKFHHIKNRKPDHGRWVIVPQNDGYFLGKYRVVCEPIEWAVVQDVSGNECTIMHFWAHLPVLETFNWECFKVHGIDTFTRSDFHR